MGGCGRWSLVVNDRRVEIILGRSGSTMGVVLDGRWSLVVLDGAVVVNLLSIQWL